MLSQTFMAGTTGASQVMGRNKAVNIVFQGDEAKTDGNTIYLPSLPANQELTAEQVGMMRGYADHEAGRIRHTNFNDLKSFSDKYEGDQKYLSMQKAVEDIRIEDRVCTEYVGAARNLEYLAESQYKGLLEQAKSIPKGSIKVKENLPLALMSQGHKDKDYDHASKLLDQFDDSDKEHLKIWSEAAAKCETTAASNRLVEHIMEIMEQDPDLSGDPEPVPDDVTDAMEGDGEPQEGESKEGEGQEGEGQEGEGQEGEGQEGEGQEGEGQEGTSSGGGEVGAVPIGDFEWGLPNDEDHLAEIKEHEWDVSEADIRPYSTECDGVYHIDGEHGPFTGYFEGANHRNYEEFSSQAAADINVMKAKLMRYLKAKENRGWDSGREQGKLDTRRLVAAYNGHQNVFRQREEVEELATAVHVLVDLSGSMRGKRIKQAGICAISLAEALDSTALKYAISGFTAGMKGAPWGEYNILGGSSGSYVRSDSLDIISYKKFDESLFLARRSLGLLPTKSMGNNNDPESVRWAAEELKKVEANRRVLIVLSDGQPAYITNGSGSSALKKEVKAIEAEGIETIGIGIQTDAVESFYNNNAVVNNTSDLANVVLDKVFKL